MTGTNLAYPLQWPAGWPRSPWHRRSSFTVPQWRAQTDLLLELDRLGASDVVISTNLPLRLDGYPRTIKSEPEDPGVAVYFTLDNEPRVIPCDKWDRVKDNIRAIERTIAALRGIDRWGAEHMMHAAFAGFSALPAGAGAMATVEQWWDVLKVPRSITAHGLRTLWPSIAKTHHPDAGGDHETFLRMKAAYEEGLRALS